MIIVFLHYNCLWIKKEDEFFKLINNSLTEEEKNKLQNDYNSQWECFMAPDGYHSIRLKESTI